MKLGISTFQQLKIVFFIIILGIALFTTYDKLQGHSSNEPLDCLGGIFQNLNNYAYKKYKFDAIGTSISSPDGILMSAGMHFQHNKQLSKDEFKIIMNDLKDHLLNDLNNNKQLRPCMKAHPFNENNIDITIFLVRDDNTDFHYPEFCVVSLGYGSYVFKTKDPDKEFGYKTYEEEKYNPSDFKN